MNSVFLLNYLCILFRYSGYADRIHELLVVERELTSAYERLPLGNNCTQNYMTEASYIEFSDVKVRCHLF